MTNAAPRKGMSRRTRLIIAGVVVTVGIGLVAFFGIRAVNAWNRFEYMRAEGLDNGTASVDAIRPWMTIRFVAVAYAVPEEYLYSVLAIPFVERKSDTTLGEINRIFQRGLGSDGQEPAIVEEIRAAIEAYRADPVVTGLHDVRAWMSLKYIANSTGVAEADLIAALELPTDVNPNKPLEIVADEEKIPGGPRTLEDRLRAYLDLAAPLPPDAPNPPKP